MEKMIEELAARYQFGSISERLESVKVSRPIQIGVLGEFSSGKSTLINALLGRKVLPAMEKPTTGNIIVLEPLKSLEKPRFRKVADDGTAEEIDGLLFNDIAMGHKQGTLMLQVPEGGLLREGVRIIDTPGLSSLEETHMDITFGYLPFLDAAIICHDINKGNLPASVTSFLNLPEVRPLLGHFIIALTHHDQKPPEEAEEIRKSCVRNLVEYCSFSDIPREELEARVVLVAPQAVLDGQRPFTMDAYSALHQRFILDRSRKIFQDKVERETRAIGQELLHLLRRSVEDFRFDASELKEKQAELEEERTKLASLKRSEQARLGKLEDEVRLSLGGMMARWVPMFGTADGEQLALLAEGYGQELTRTISDILSRHFNGIDLPNLQHLGQDVAQRVMNVIKIKDMLVTAATAVATAVVAPGVGLSANAVEGAVGAAVIEATKDEKPQENIGKGSFLARLGQTIQAINPVGIIGELFSRPFRKSASRASLRDINHTVMMQVRSVAELFLEQEILRPLDERLDGLHDALQLVMRNKKRTIQDQEKELQRMRTDIADLERTLGVDR